MAVPTLSSKRAAMLQLLWLSQMDSETLYGITVLHPRADGHRPPSTPIVFDLVAVHGLNGHALETWTHKQTRIMWLRDLLPELVPNVRIMTYGYNAKFRNFTGHQDLRNISSKLLAELVDMRRSEEEMCRPLVFACHSLGGIVAKKALLLNCPQEQKAVQDACYGMLFMGTPHKGSSIATLGKLVANIISTCTPINPARSLLGTSKPDSKALFEITEDFVREASRLQLISFFEMEMTTVGFSKKLIVDHRSAILNLPNEIAIGQNANHRDIARFKSANDRNFRPVISRLQKFKHDIETNGRSMGLSEISVEVSSLEGTSSVFDLPFSPSKSFHGREHFLEHMERYYFETPRVGEEQLTFAICGLGGSGKTQTALQFAVRNRLRYKSGIIFINASSYTTLTADFDKVSELMRLGNSSNKIAAVKSWLSDEKNKHWLLIFDNADDLASICISKYFPAAAWGHIIITSRDHSVIGFAGCEGSSMEPLGMTDAIAMLLHNANIKAPTDEMKRDAIAIAEALGRLPLALDQAGAYMKSRMKSMPDYRRLYSTRQEDLLKFHPRLSDYTTSVLAAWELNFAQVETESPEAARLLLLFCFLDAAGISDNMLFRGCTPQNRWSRDGEIEQISAEAAGIDPYLIKLITDEVCFDSAIEKLLCFSLLRRNNDFNEARSVSLHPLVQYCASQRVTPTEQNKWRQQAILLVCQAFPRNQYIEDTFGTTGRPQLPHVSRILVEYNKIAEELPTSVLLKRQMVSCLLAASRFLDNSWKRDCIERARHLLHGLDDHYLNAWITQRESALARMYNRHEESQRTLENFVSTTFFPEKDAGLGGDARSNAQRGELVVSHAENLIQADQLEAAENELLGWEPLNLELPSMMECLILRSRNTNIGRVLRDQGKFLQSLSYFELLHQDTLFDEHYDHTGQRRIILSNMSDLYCELNRANDAVRLVQTEIEHMISTGSNNISSGRRLKICLVEAYLCLGRSHEARESLIELREALEVIVDPDILSKNCLFRVWYGLARLAHTKGDFEDARDCWLQAIQAGNRCGWDTEYPMDMVRYSLAHVFFELGDFEKGMMNLEAANASFEKGRRKYWTVGLCTYWYDYVSAQLRLSPSGSAQLCIIRPADATKTNETPPSQPTTPKIACQ